MPALLCPYRAPHTQAQTLRHQNEGIYLQHSQVFLDLAEMENTALCFYYLHVS